MRLKNEQWIDTDGAEGSGAEGAGQAGDTQGLPSASDEAEESVQDLVETGQYFQAELVEGMEDAADHPEEPATTQQDRRSSGGESGPYLRGRVVAGARPISR